MSGTFEFPQYRKYPNEKHFFKIISKDEFEEIAVMGSHYSIHHKVAKILPDRNLILDMLTHFGDHYLLSEEKEYEAVKTFCRNNLQEF